MKIMRIESLVYGVDDLDAGSRYFDDWGVPALERGSHGVDYRLPSGQTILLRQSGDKNLPPAVEPGSTLRETIWGVDTAASLDAVGAALGQDRPVARHTDGTLHSRDPAGFAIGFALSQPATPETPAPAPAPRLNHPYAPPPRATPRRIGHAVFNIVKSAVKPSQEFYLDRLQFRLSERALDLGDFMRCAGASDHHNLFLAHREDRTRFNHVAFEVGSLDELIVGGKFMQSHGWQAATKPGRHIMGSNIFWYFQNPCGGHTEYFTDMDVMDDDWQAPIWEKNPGYAAWMME